MRIAHISDLHFAKITFNPLQFFSKRWIGNLNLLLCRQREFEPKQVLYLLDLFKELKVDSVIISGDLSTTSLRQEFSLAADFIKKIKASGIQVFALPGNHDHYTKNAYRKKIFYDFFNSTFSSEQSPFSAYNLKEHAIAVKKLSNDWWVIILDTAFASNLISSRGNFSPELERRLETVLLQIPKDHSVIIANHFPLFQNESPRKSLMHSEKLREIIHRFSNIKLYLHGHTHRHCIADLRPNGMPIVLDSGSTTHRQDGSWNLIDISPNGCTVQVFQCNPLGKNSALKWQKGQQINFSW